MENAVKIYNSDLSDEEKFENLCELREDLDMRARTLKKAKADVDSFLIRINERTEVAQTWENQDGTAKIEVKEEIRYKVDKAKFLELTGSPDHLEKFLASKWFKISEIKKDDPLKECWRIERTGVIKVDRIDPEFMAEMKARIEEEKRKKEEKAA